MLLNLLAEESQGIGTWILFGVLVAFIIALFVWQSISGKKKQQEAQNMVNSLKKGDRVKTIGGVCGFVYEINNEENTFVLETGSDDNKSYIKFDKGAIYQTAPKEGAAVAAEKAAEQETEEAPAEPFGEENAPIETEAKPKKKSNKKAKAEVVEEVAEAEATEEVKEEVSETEDKE